MFRLEVFVDDRRLAQTITALAGLVIDLKVHPVINAKKANGEVTAIGHGSMIEMVADHLAKRDTKVFTKPVVAAFLKANGRSPVSAGNMMTRLRDGKYATSKGKGKTAIWTYTGGKS